MLLIAVLVIIFLYVFLNSGPEKLSRVKPVRGPAVRAVYALGTVKTDQEFNLRLSIESIITRLHVREGSNVAKGSPLLTTDMGVTMRSPFDGQISTLNYKERETVSGGQIVMTVTGSGAKYIVISLDQESVYHIRKGQRAEISFEYLRDLKVPGRVDSVYPSAGEFLVRIDPGPLPVSILPEMTCDVAVVVEEKKDALLIPSAAVTDGFVTVIDKGKKRRVKPALGSTYDGKVEVTDGSITEDNFILVGSPADQGRGRKSK